MKKKLIMGIVYLSIGIICILLALLMSDNLNGFEASMFGLGGAGIGAGVMMLYKYHCCKSEKDNK